jgi:hypothetical protein
MSEFDPIKAIREEITGLVEVSKAITIRERHAEEQLGQAEIELNALRKLGGFAKAELERKREVLRRLTEQQ